MSSRQIGNPLLEMTSFQYFLDPRMEADYQFNNYRVIFLSLSYHAENPLYLPMKLSFFPTGTFDSTSRFQHYLLLHCDVNINAEICGGEKERDTIDSSNPNLMLDHFTFIQEKCLAQNITLLVSWSLEEAANYLTMLKLWGSKT